MSVRALPLFVLAASAISGHAIGGMNSPRFWSLFFLFTAVSSLVAPRFATVVLQDAPAYRPPPPPPQPDAVPEAPELTALAR